MTYRIARDGKIHGPYTTADVQAYLASGNIAPGDLAQSESMDEWLPVSQVFPPAITPAIVYAGGLPRIFRDPPNLPWWVALILELVTGLAFFFVWDIVEAAWMRRVERSSIAIWFYILALVLFLLSLPNSIHAFAYQFLDGPALDAPHAWILSTSGLVVRLIARFVFRDELLRHFNRAEPIGLRLNWFLTLIFGGLYFQYHFNRINEVKRVLRLSVPSV